MLATRPPPAARVMPRAKGDLRRNGRFRCPLFEKKRQLCRPPAGRKVAVARPESRGNFTVDLVLPNGAPEAVVVFMHGFSQYPLAYWETLRELALSCNAIVAGIFSPRVWRRWLDRSTPEMSLQEALQRTLAEDTLQMAEMMEVGDPPFDRLGLRPSLPRVAMGHSMGGGLCPYVARKAGISAVMTMAPFPELEKDLDPALNLRESPPREALFVAGGWDLVARDSGGCLEPPGEAIRELAAMTDNAVFSLIPHGTHTGFEDELVVGDFPLLEGAGALPTPVGFLERAIKAIYTVFRGHQCATDQLDATEAQLIHFLERVKEVGPAGRARLCVDEFREAMLHDDAVRPSIARSVELERFGTVSVEASRPW